MRVLIACEFSGIVRREFAKRGHDAWSCDILPAEDLNDKHYQCDVLRTLDNGWDLMIAHPPCTYLCSSGLHWNKKNFDRAKNTELALEFVKKLLDSNIEKIALENPIGCISTRIRKPDQIIQPYEYGHDASKATCLWLKNLPKLIDTEYILPRFVNGKNRWSNQTDSGQNRLPPSKDRWKLRSQTYKGIAQAMASQWGVNDGI